MNQGGAHIVSKMRLFLDFEITIKKTLTFTTNKGMQE